MVSKNRGTYGFWGTSWVLITMAPRNKIVLRCLRESQCSYRNTRQADNVHARSKVNIIPGTTALVGAPIYLVTQCYGVSGNRSCCRKTRSTDNVHTKANANVMLLCATWYANKVNVCGAHCK